MTDDRAAHRAGIAGSERDVALDRARRVCRVRSGGGRLRRWRGPYRWPRRCVQRSSAGVATGVSAGRVERAFDWAIGVGRGSVEQAGWSLGVESSEPLVDGSGGDAGGLGGFSNGPALLQDAGDEESSAVRRGSGVRMELHSGCPLGNRVSWFSTDRLRGPRMNNVLRNHS